MKKLLLSLLMVAGVSAFAQKDLEVKLASPLSADTIRRGEAFNLVAQFKNVGAEDIPQTDSLIVKFTLNGSPLSIGQANSFRVAFLGNGLKQDSVIYLPFNNLSFPQITYGDGQICVEASLRSNLIVVVEPTGNNLGCNNVFFKYAVGLAEITAAASVKVYPNPASDVVNFSIDYNKAAKVSVMDITGRLVATTNFDFNNASVNVSNYNKGIYVYQITNNNGEVVKAGKFTVN